jgi:hypothetical protein
VDHVPNFHIKELVCQQMYQVFNGNRAFMLQLFNPNALITLQALRNRFGVTTVNNWHVGGGNQYRGFRPFHCAIGARLSQHKLGNAFDSSFADYTAEEVRQYILANPHEFPHITAIEGQVSWLHFDVRPSNWDGIKVFNP